MNRINKFKGRGVQITHSIRKGLFEEGWGV